MVGLTPTGLDLGPLAPSPQRVDMHPDPRADPYNSLVQRETSKHLIGLRYLVVRWTVGRLMKILDIGGVQRGKKVLDALEMATWQRQLGS